MSQYSPLCGVLLYINFRLRRKRPLSKMAAPELQAVLEQLLEPDNAVIQQVTDTGRRSGRGEEAAEGIAWPGSPPTFFTPVLGHRPSA